MSLEPSDSTVAPWYGSGTFWAIAAVVVAVVAIAVGAWAAFRSANPRRVLYITMPSAVSLLRSEPEISEGIEVLHKGRPLSQPYLVTVEVLSRSSRDIPRPAFGAQPLNLDVGAPVIELLDSWSHSGRSAVPVPALTVTSTGLHVGPALLTRRHHLGYILLVDGPPQLQVMAEMADIDIRGRADPDREGGWVKPTFAIIMISLGAAVFDQLGAVMTLPLLLIALSVYFSLTPESLLSRLRRRVTKPDRR
ncbi:hypothetical protein OG992_28905 [Micromonospora sp. NBC_00362]|uniref:hypothetical protein n=1 Tax=Micromonospora sp. NBC_00362 TaxID=2975975 RepID=UPI0022576434|nr:hypothetical protein [Micromonospora sp. NBC_00362]MCX5121204.1 hypothetical protein [Micromonospora sp. NBC_00362]